MARLPPVPRSTQLVKSVKDLLVHFSWDNWFQQIVDLFTATPGVVGRASLTGQTASIGATNLNMGTLAAGLYRTSVSADVTQAATVSSSLAYALGWTYGGVARTFTGSTITNGTTASYQQDVVAMQVDASTNVTYSATYASSGATPMSFSLAATLEQLP